MRSWSWVVGVLCGGLTATSLCAGAVTLLDGRHAPRAALITDKAAVAKSAPRPDVAPQASLFVGRQGGSLFEPYARKSTLLQGTARGLQNNAVHVIRQIIEQAESRRDGYDAVQHGARIKPARKPTQMTVAEIYEWIEATPGQPHAIGRYQFIPVTLRRVMKKVGAHPSQRFSPALQDQLADVLLAEAGYHEIKAGRLSRRAFMNNLAKIWAGLPNDTGRSHYAGYAGNKASMSWERFDAQMAQVFVE
ncbi:MAG: hypothetical protein ABJN72_12930 [Sulfitobacter sp.]